MAVYVVYTNDASGGSDTLYIRRTGDTNTSRRLNWDIDSSNILGAKHEADIEVNGSQSLDHYWNRNETFTACQYFIREFTDDYAGEATQ
jgi:hypothetical protein